MNGRVDVIARHLASYRVDHDRREIERTFRDILDAGTFLGEECRFLYWCCHEFGMRIPFPLPGVAELPVKPIPVASFEARFGNSERRVTLLRNLSGFLGAVKASAGLDRLDVIVGGSFVDPGESDPDDIDMIICIPPNRYRAFEDDEQAIKRRIRRPLGLDVVFLPTDFALASFRAFSRVMCLCNDLDVRPEDWQPFPIGTIAFTPRRLHAFSA